METSSAPSPSSLLVLVLLAVMAIAPLVSPVVRAQSPFIQEIMIDQPSVDRNEHFKIAGAPGTSLNGLTYVVLGDFPGSGVIEEATDLSGHTIPASGLFVVAENTFSLGNANLTTVLDFENSDNVTHLLVTGFTGESDQNLDPNNDGVLDVVPWTTVVDKIAAIEERNPPVGTEWHYGPPTIGPHGSRSPQHIYRCFGDWRIFDTRPKSGGDDGSVTIRIPLRFQPDMVIRLARDDGWEIPASRIVGDPTDGTCLVLATFDLAYQPLGFWNLVVEYQDGEVFLGPNAFTVVESKPADLWIDVIGRTTVRAGREEHYQVLYGSHKDIDFTDVLFWIAVPNNVEATVDLPYLVDVGSGFDDLADPIEGLQYFWFYADQLGPGETRAANLKIRLLSPGTIQIYAGITEEAWIIDRTAAATLDDVSPRGFEMRKALGSGDLVFKSSDPADPIPSGHVGLSYIDGGGTTWVLDFVRDGACHLGGAYCDGRPRKVPFADWALGPGTYQGSASPPGISQQQAENAAENAHVAYTAWQQSGEPVVAFFLPPRGTSVGALPAAWNAVSWIDDRYHAIGYAPPWSSWASPGMLYAWSTGVLWPQPRHHAFKLFRNFSLQLLFDSAVWQAIEYRTLPRITVRTVASRDPNEKVGSQGSGELQYLSAGEDLRYVIRFENMETATAPAQEVVITDVLDTNTVDVDTLELLAITFGDTVISLPRGTMTYTGEVRVPGQVLEEIIVRIEVSFEPVTSLLTWRLSTIDPATGEWPSDPFEGFLPPNLEPPEGDGSVLLTIKPKEGLITGTEIHNSASIVFDFNPPIDTGEWVNAVDNSAPQSHVVALEAEQCSVSFEVAWTGTDEGAGVRDYSIFVSEDGATYTPWLTETDAAAGLFAGQPGQSYWFYSTCRDQTGNREEPALVHDAMTTIVHGHDSDGDTVPDACDQCLGNDTAGDGDGDQICADVDCDDADPNTSYIDHCGVCGGNDSTCLIFADDFELGATSAWSRSLG